MLCSNSCNIASSGAYVHGRDGQILRDKHTDPHHIHSETGRRETRHQGITWCERLVVGRCFSFFFFLGLDFPFPENRAHLISILILPSALFFQFISCICFPFFFCCFCFCFCFLWATSNPNGSSILAWFVRGWLPLCRPETPWEQGLSVPCGAVGLGKRHSGDAGLRFMCF